VVDTKEKILDSAETLFGEQGYGATSLRHIIAHAGVNLASVHYHFGSKEDLLDAVVRRKLTPINTERMALLAAAEAEVGADSLPAERLLEAFLRPALMRAGNDPQFCRLMGRLHGEGLMPGIARKNFQEIAERFLGGLRRAMPGVSDEEAAWRIHFMIGAMAQTMKGVPEYPGMAVGKVDDLELLLHRILTFLAAGFRAPATESAKAVEVKQ